MGTWGMSAFENDDALDWLADLNETGDLSALEAAFAAEEIQGYYLEAPECVRILCAAEVLAAASGSASDSLPPEAAEWVLRHNALPFGSLLNVARAKVSRVLAPHSELRELWQENETDFPTWLAFVNDLQRRLGV